MASEGYLNRPCWKCGQVIPGDAAAHFRKVGLKSVQCSNCGAVVSLYGEPCKKWNRVGSARP